MTRVTESNTLKLELKNNADLVLFAPSPPLYVSSFEYVSSSEIVFGK